MNTTQTLTISQLTQNTAQVIGQIITDKSKFVIYQRSRPKAVLVDYDYYSKLEEAVLDATDSKEAEIAKTEPTDTFDSYITKRWKNQASETPDH